MFYLSKKKTMGEGRSKPCTSLLEIPEVPIELSLGKNYFMGSTCEVQLR